MEREPDPAQTTAGSILGTKWKPRVLLALATEGRLGFGDLQTELEGISNKVLSDDLSALREHGVVSRDVVQEQPRRVEYELTAAGRELVEILESMAAWDAAYVEGTGSPTVLLAEDDDRLLRLYSLWLESDYDVVTAAEGRDALRRLDDAIDVAVLDRTLPTLPGEEIARTISSLASGTAVALLSSAQVSPADVTLPADRILEKPVTKTALCDAVDELQRLADASPLAREIDARRHRLAFVERHLGSSVTTTESYRQVSAELDALEARREQARDEREPWRRLLEQQRDPVEGDSTADGDVGVGGDGSDSATGSASRDGEDSDDDSTDPRVTNRNNQSTHESASRGGEHPDY